MQKRHGEINDDGHSSRVPEVRTQVAPANSHRSEAVSEVQVLRAEQAERAADEPLQGDGMSWAKLDDSFPTHPKIITLSDAAFRVFVTAITYSAKYLTDGFIPTAVGGALHPEPTAGAAAIEELLERGLFEPAHVGYQVHDYLDWQPSRADVLAVRAAKAAAGSRGGKSRTKHMLKQTLSTCSSKR